MCDPMKKLAQLLGAFLVGSLLLTSCFKGDDEVIIPNQNNGDILNLDSLRTPDPGGNLVVRNYSGQELVLYEFGSADSLGPLKIIPNDPADFTVDIPLVTNRPKVDFILCRYSDVADSLIRGDVTQLIYARWLVSADGGTAVDKRLYWHVPDEAGIPDDKGEIGSMRFRYSLNTEYEIDIVFSDFYPPAKYILPGEQVEISLPYDTYSLEYWYYSRNSPNPQDRTWEGTRATEIVNDEEVPIYVVLKQSSPSIFKLIPSLNHGGGGNNGAIDQGQLRVWNLKSFPITVYADIDVMIEEIGFREDCKSELGVNDSDIIANAYEVYCMHEGDYMLYATNPAGDIVLEKTVSVVADSLVNWIVE